jgi:quinolinate synthase
MSEYVELFMDQGADFSVTVQINSEDDNLAQNLDGYVVTSQLRKSLLSINAAANLVCTIPDPNLGEVFVELDAANTANIPAGTYMFDIKVNDTLTGLRSRLIEGIMFVTPSITR